MTSVAPAVPQLVLPGQAAAPEGPVDIAPMYLMHRAFRRDLDAFARTVPAVPPSDAARWARLARRFAFFGSVLHKHHRGEDVALWPLLAERGADPAVLDALQAEHAAIDPLLASAHRRPRHARRRHGRRGHPRPPDGHRAAGSATLLGAHLAHEERDGMAARAAAPHAGGLGPAGPGGLRQGLPAAGGPRRPGLGDVRPAAGPAAPAAARAPTRCSSPSAGSSPAGSTGAEAPASSAARDDHRAADRALTVVSRVRGPAAHVGAEPAVEAAGWATGSAAAQVLLLTHRGRTVGHGRTRRPLALRAGRRGPRRSPPPTAASTSSRSGGGTCRPTRAARSRSVAGGSTSWPPRRTSTTAHASGTPSTPTSTPTTATRHRSADASP